MTAETTAVAVQRLVPEILQRLFGDQAYRYDLEQGTIVSATGSRIVYLSTDLLRGIHEALEYEVSDAWQIVLKNCGYVWGRRVAASLEQELRAVAQLELTSLPLAEYLHLLERYFAKHGWGIASFNLDDTPVHGIVRVSLRNSLFVNALEHVNSRVDPMIAGILRGLLEAIAGRELDCVEACCSRLQPGRPCEFLISGPLRVRAIESLAESGIALHDALKQLREA